MVPAGYGEFPKREWWQGLEGLGELGWGQVYGSEGLVECFG